MEQITIATILQKIRAIAQELGLDPLPHSAPKPPGPLHLQQHFSALERIRLEILKGRALEEEYSKLELLLQKQETDIRKRIGVEQQFKLYTDTLKSQVEELQAEKLDLLENSKAYIKQLKRTNQALYVQIQSHSKPRRDKSKSVSPLKTELSKHNKSQSHCKSRHDKSIKQIIKTEYIERDRSHSGKKPKIRKKAKMGAYSTISAQDKLFQENAKTFQVIGTHSRKKDKGTTSKKKNQNVFSNFTLLNILDSSHKKRRKGDTGGKSPERGNRKKEGSRVAANGKGLWRQKKANKSVLSVLSGEASQSKKETI